MNKYKTYKILFWDHDAKINDCCGNSKSSLIVARTKEEALRKFEKKQYYVGPFRLRGVFENFPDEFDTCIEKFVRLRELYDETKQIEAETASVVRSALQSTDIDKLIELVTFFNKYVARRWERYTNEQLYRVLNPTPK